MVFSARFWESSAFQGAFFIQFFPGRQRFKHTGTLGAADVTADLRNPETPTIYPVEVGTEFEVRCYKVSIIDDAEGELDITVLGSIPTDE